MTQLGNEIEGCTFKRGGTIFMVMEAEDYPRARVSPQYRDVLSTGLGLLVAIPYRGTLIPNITVRGGVVRLIKVAVQGEIISTPKAISAALGIRQPYHPYTLNRIV